MINVDELIASAVPFALPLRREFRGLTVREGVLIKGPSGWGEFAPFDDYSALQSSRWLASALESAFGAYPAAVRTAIPVNAIIPAVHADDAAALTREAVQVLGCTTIKIKVGGALRDDEARVASVRDALDTALGRGKGAIRIDANTAWSVDEAVRSLRRLAAYDLEYVEQPCRTADELRDVRRAIDVRIAADESVRLSDDPASVAVAEFADVVILKAAPLGGAQALLDIAERLDLPVVVSGSLDSATGLDVGVAAAAALPELPFACGLGTGALLSVDISASPRIPHEGVIAVERTAPDLDALLAARDRVSDVRVAFWQSRLREAFRELMRG